MRACAELVARAKTPDTVEVILEEGEGYARIHVPMGRPSYKELQQQVKALQQQAKELIHLVNLKIYPQNLHFETRDLLYFRFDNNWYFDFFDKRLAELTGHDIDDFRDRKLRWLDIVHEDDRPLVREAVAKGIGSEKFFETEFRVVKKSGEIAWIRMRGPILCDEESRFLAVQGIMDDITSRKRIEIALESEREVFAWVADSMDDGIYIVSDDYRIQFMNKALINLLGNHVGEICYRALYQRESVCPWSVMDTIKQSICGFQEYHLPEFEKTFQVRSFPVKRRDGSTGKLGQLKDITRARKLQYEVEDYAFQYQAIVDAANKADLGIFILQDHNGMEARFRYANAALRRITGYDEKWLLSKSIMELVAPESSRKMLNRYRRRQRGDSLDNAYELKMIRKDGIPITVFISVAVSSYEGNVATIGFLQDFTEKKKFEKSLWLSQRLASIGKLAAEIAHEINNPLTSILTFTKLVDRIFHRQPFPMERLPELAKYISYLDSEATRCAQIARNLLDFSRHAEVDLKNNDVHEILEKTLDVLRHRARMNEIAIETTYAPDVSLIFCDFKRMQQAFMNILWNAVEAMPEGGILRVSTRCNSENQMVEIVITDTGIGIPEESLESIFEPFFTTKSEGKGVGLGLSVAYGIIRQHRGMVHVQSQLGKGTSFTVQLRMNAPSVVNGIRDDTCAG